MGELNGYLYTFGSDKVTTGANELTKKVISGVKKDVKKASNTVQLLQRKKALQSSYDARLIAKHGAGYDPNEVRKIQRLLVLNGFLDNSNGKAIDGDWGNNTESAWLLYLLSLQSKSVVQTKSTNENDGLTLFGKAVKWMVGDLLPLPATYLQTPTYNAKIDRVLNPKLKIDTTVNGTPVYYDDKSNSIKLAHPYMSRLGNLGLVKTKDSNGNDIYEIYNALGLKITWCSATTAALANVLNNNVHIRNNAWNQTSDNGETVLYNGYSKKSGKYSPIKSFIHNVSAGLKTSNAFDDIDFLSGDMVSLYAMNSDHNDLAWNEGTDNRANSHVGMVFRPDPSRKDNTYVIHNISGKVYVLPLADFLFRLNNMAPDWLITRASRPNSVVSNKQGGRLIPKCLNGTNTSLFSKFMNFIGLGGIKLPNKPLDRYGNLTKECAAYVNKVLLDNGIKSYGNAYSINSQFKNFVNGYLTMKVPDMTGYSQADSLKTIHNFNKLAAVNVKKNLDTSKLNPKHVYTVNMYYQDGKEHPSLHTIDFFNKAKKSNTGTYGTHTGLLYNDNGEWKVSHNIQGQIIPNKLTSILGDLGNWGITAIADAGNPK